MAKGVEAEFSGVTVTCKANVYFDGKVVSHAFVDASGRKRTLGLIFPGTYNFSTGAPERMDIVAGACRARLPGQADFKDYPAGTGFDVPGQSSFDIAVDAGIAEYLCTFD